MSKDPAILFYPADFIIGTADMTNEEVGQYIRILSYMHQKGRLDEKTIRLLVGSVSVSVKSKFKQDEKTYWFNERLEQEIEKRRKFTESRRLNGQKGGRPKGTKKIFKKNHMDNHMENENENIRRGVQGGGSIKEILEDQNDRERMKKIYQNLKNEAIAKEGGAVEPLHAKVPAATDL